MHSCWISVCACLNFRTSNQIEFENFKLERQTENKKEKGRAGLAWAVFISAQIRPFLFGFTWWAEFTHVGPLLPFSAVTDEWAPQPLPLARTSGRHRCCACVPSASHYCSDTRLDPLAGGARRPVAPAVVLQLTPTRGPACSALHPRHEQQIPTEQDIGGIFHARCNKSFEVRLDFCPTEYTLGRSPRIHINRTLPP